MILSNPSSLTLAPKSPPSPKFVSWVRDMAQSQYDPPSAKVSNVATAGEHTYKVARERGRGTKKSNPPLLHRIPQSKNGRAYPKTNIHIHFLKLAGLACHEEEEKSRTELLEKLRTHNKITLVELCRSFDIPGSTANKKDELVAIVMDFLMEYCSGIDGTNPDKKFKKRRRKREGVNLSGGKRLKKKKPEGTALETHGEEEADGRKGEEDRTNYSGFDLKDSRNECADNKKGQFPKEEANPEPSERVNGSMSENLDGVALTEGVALLKCQFLQMNKH